MFERPFWDSGKSKTWTPERKKIGKGSPEHSRNHWNTSWAKDISLAHARTFLGGKLVLFFFVFVFLFFFPVWEVNFGVGGELVFSSSLTIMHYIFISQETLLHFPPHDPQSPPPHFPVTNKTHITHFSTSSLFPLSLSFSLVSYYIFVVFFFMFGFPRRFVIFADRDIINSSIIVELFPRPPLFVFLTVL